MTIKAKTLVKDKFWIVEEHGQKLGTLQKKDDNGWIFLSKKDHRQVFHTQESLFTRFGFNIFEKPSTPEEPIIEQTNFEVHGYPCSQKPYNPLWNVQKGLPLYTKTPKSKSMFCAGYYIVKFETVNWRKAYCPKIITLQRYPYKGPMESKTEMVSQLNDALKNSN